MKHPQVVVFESDGRLAGQLHAMVTERRWVLRESRRAEPCLKLLCEGGPAVFVVRLEEPPGAELSLLARVAGQIPGVRTVAVGGITNATLLAGLACDLGVDFALVPPLSSETLPDIVAGLMGAS